MKNNGVMDFCEKMDVLFKGYKKDGVMDRYHKDGIFFTVGKKDADYVWSSLDGAAHIYNMMCPENKVTIEHVRTTSVTETYIVQYEQ